MRYCSRRSADFACDRIDGSPMNHENAPVGLAIIARRLEEEKVVSMLEVIRDCLEAEAK